MKTFRPYDPDQVLLMPPSLQDWVDAEHPARLVSELVDRVLDLGPIMASYESTRGYPPYDPRLLLKVLLHGAAEGISSARRLADACAVRVDFMFLAAGQRPDFRTIWEFRRRHADAFEHLFDEVLRVCCEAGIVKLGHVSVDGTRMKANASMGKAMSYAGIGRRYLEECERNDEIEDELYGDKQGNELPPHLRDPKERIERLRRAKRELEQRAANRASDKRVRDKDQYNFTDPESRVMKDGPSRGWMQAYNAQVVVDDTPHKIIIAADVFNQASDQPQLKPMVEQVKRRFGFVPKVSADAGFNAEKNLDWLRDNKIDAYIAMGKRGAEPDGPPPRGRIPARLTSRERMERKMRTKYGRAVYRRRKHTVEPVFGMIKQGRGMRQFLTRGLDNVRNEWKLTAIGHNISRLAASGHALTPRPA